MTNHAASATVILFMSAYSAAGMASDAREKADVITVRNGDRITGEIKSLAYGRLTLETDSMGTVNIEWPDVVRVESPQKFLIEDTGGNLIYGHIDRDPQAGYLSVAGTGPVVHRVELSWLI